MPVQTPIQASQPAPTASQPQQGPPKVPGADTSYQKRIDELYGQANYYKREAAEMRERIARLEGRNEAEPAPEQRTRGTPRSFQEMEDGELSKAWDYALSDDTKNPQMLDQIVEERIRRRMEKMSSQVAKDTTKQIQQNQLLRDTNARILQDFGPEAFQDGTELREAALEFMAQYIERYGKDAVSKSPDYQYDAFLRAERKLKTLSDRERMTQLEQENKVLQTKASLLERGGAIGMASKPSDKVTETLRAGGPNAVRDSIKGLRLTQNLVNDVKGRLVTPGR